MFQQIHEAVQAVIRLVQKKGYSDKTVEEIRRYEREFEKHLFALDKLYDFDTVVHRTSTAMPSMVSVSACLDASPGMVDSFGGISVDSSLSDPGKTPLSSEVDGGVSG